ncbi:MAG: LPS export ABC transporter permease LptF [Pseudomonadota bacterium]
MIITRYLFREILGTAIALLSILLLIFLSHRFIRYLADASAGELPSQFIYQLLGLKLLSVMSIIIPLAFFLAVLLVVGRLYTDNEMAAMGACGIGLPFLLQRLVLLSLCVAMLVGYLSLWVSPWAERTLKFREAEAAHVADIAGVVAGRFKNFSRGNGVFYVEDVDKENQRMLGVFVALDQLGKKTLLASEVAYETFDEITGARYLLMEEGRRYEGTPGQADFTVTEFESHSILLSRAVSPEKRIRMDMISSEELWRSNDPAYQAELQVRYSTALSLVLLTVLAVLLSHTTPRQGRYAKVLVAILIYFLYANLIQISQKSVARGQLPVDIGVWWVHGLMLAAIIGLMIQRGVISRYMFLRQPKVITG